MRKSLHRIESFDRLEQEDAGAPPRIRDEINRGSHMNIESQSVHTGRYARRHDLCLKGNGLVGGGETRHLAASLASGQPLQAVSRSLSLQRGEIVRSSPGEDPCRNQG